MPYKTIIDILVEELAEIRILEEQFVNLLPEMIAATQDSSLRHAFVSYQDRTQLFLKYFDQMADVLNIPTKTGQYCVMRVTFGQNLGSRFEECSHHAVDAALIGMALKMESYLSAAYLNACVHARMLGLEELCELLKSRMKSNFPPSPKTFEKATFFEPERGGDDPIEAAPAVNAGLAG